MLISDAFSRNYVLGWDRACDFKWTGCVISMEKLWMVAPEMCRQASANLVVIVAQCPLSCQVQTHFFKVDNNFRFHLLDFLSSHMNMESIWIWKVFFLEYQGDQRRWWWLDKAEKLHRSKIRMIVLWKCFCVLSLQESHFPFSAFK